MSFAMKARLLARQGMSTEEILQTVIAEADRKIEGMDRRLARFVEEATPEQIAWLNEDLGIGSGSSETEETSSPTP